MDDHRIRSHIKQIHIKKETLVFSLTFLLITAMFAMVPLPGGDDWGFFRSFTHRVDPG